MSSLGVGLSFFMVTLGQALGAPTAGVLIDTHGATTTFILCALTGATVVVERPVASSLHPMAGQH